MCSLLSEWEFSFRSLTFDGTHTQPKYWHSYALQTYKIIYNRMNDSNMKCWVERNNLNNSAKNTHWYRKIALLIFFFSAFSLLCYNFSFFFSFSGNPIYNIVHTHCVVRFWHTGSEWTKKKKKIWNEWMDFYICVKLRLFFFSAVVKPINFPFQSIRMNFTETSENSKFMLQFYFWILRHFAIAILELQIKFCELLNGFALGVVIESCLLKL